MEKIQRQVKKRNVFGYSLCDFLGGGGNAIIGAWLLFFYTTFCGLNPVKAASIFAIAKLVDAFMDPWIGNLSDNLLETKLGKRFGRRRLLMMIGIPLLLDYALLWVAGMGYIFYLVTYVSYGVIVSLIMIPFETLGSEMTSNYGVRSKLAGARTFVSQLSTFIGAYIPGRFFAAYGKDNPKALLYTGILYTAMMMVAVVICLNLTWERDQSEIKIISHKISFIETVKRSFIDMASTFRIRSFRQHLGMYVSAFVGMDVISAVFTYYVVFGLGKSTIVVSNIITFMAIFQFVMVPFFIWLCIKSSPAATMRVAVILMILSVLGYGAVYYLGLGTSIIAIYGVTVLMGIAKSGINYVPWNVFAFMPDIDQMVTTKRREGVFGGIMNFTRKVTSAIAVFILGIVLQMVGFQTGAHHVQSLHAVHGILGVMVVIPIILYAITIAITLKFKVTEKNHKILMSEIGRLQDGGKKSEVDSKTKTVVEYLTGISYDKLWGNNNVGYQYKLDEDSK